MIYHLSHVAAHVILHGHALAKYTTLLRTHYFLRGRTYTNIKNHSE